MSNYVPFSFAWIVHYQHLQKIMRAISSSMVHMWCLIQTRPMKLRGRLGDDSFNQHQQSI
jgi:hypothetical protein